jgi:hypothetical protein
MGANLIPIVRNFRIAREIADQHSIDDGCLTPGVHRLLRFDFLTHNIADHDLVVGDPADHPEWFMLSDSHGHYHLIDFNEFLLTDSSGTEIAGAKQAFCLMDIEHSSPWGPRNPRYHCGYQGVSAGWADVYHSGLPCQFVVIDDVPDGLYVLKSTTNAQQLLPEDTYADNSIWTYLRITGDTVIEINPRARMTDFAKMVDILFGVSNDGGGVVIGPDGIPIPIDPWGVNYGAEAAGARNLVAGLLISELASLLTDVDAADRLRAIAGRTAEQGMGMIRTGPG